MDEKLRDDDFDSLQKPDAGLSEMSTGRHGDLVDPLTASFAAGMTQKVADRRGLAQPRSRAEAVQATQHRADVAAPTCLFADRYKDGACGA